MPTLLSPGTTLYAQARPFSEYELLAEGVPILRLVYKFDAAVEEQKGIAFGCNYESHAYALHYFPTPWLQRESYRVVLDGAEVLATGTLKVFQTMKVTYADGPVWNIQRRIGEISVLDSASVRVVQCSRQIGFIMGRSKIQIEASVEIRKLIPILLIATHLTTHQSE